MKQNSIRTLVYAALLTAFVAVATMFIKIPLLFGYANMGDGLIFAAAYVLGPIGAVVGALGSAIADAASGYMLYLPATLVIKALMGFVAGKLMCRKGGKKGYLKNAAVFVACEAIMVAGYFLFEGAVFTFPSAALGLVPNICQGVVGVIIGLLLCLAIEKSKILER